MEAVGLVLAVVPIVLSALENYKAGVHLIQKLYQVESQLRLLIISLKVQHAKFKLNLEKVLRAAAPDANLQEVPEDYDSILWRGDTADKVKAYLHTGYEAFRFTVEEYEACVKRIAYKLRHVNRPKAAAKDDLKALIAANPRVEGSFSWKKRVEFTMKQKDLTELVKKLDQSNLTLSGFIADGDMLDRLQTHTTDHLQAMNLSTRLHTVRKHAESLHGALHSARLPECLDSHHIALHLEDRLLQMEASKPSTRPEISFHISVAANTSPAQWCQAVVTVSRPAISFQQPIDDLCLAIRRAEHLGYSFHLLHDLIVKLPSSLHQKHAENVDTTTLANLLQCNTTITPKNITILALKLASSLVQLGATGWLEDCWTKDAITFFPFCGKVSDYVSSPLICKTFHNISANPTSTYKPIKPIDALFELGVLLLEIGHQKSFETWLSENILTCVDHSRFARLPRAIQWHEESDGVLSIKYRIVIARCLKCSFDEYTISWDDTQFRQAICRDIIEPLRQNATIW